MKRAELVSAQDLLLVRSPAHKELISFPADTTQQQALDLLDKYGILSAPVKSKEDGEYLGIVDRIDILTPVLFRPVDPKNPTKIPEEKDHSWPTLDALILDLLKVSPESTAVSSGVVTWQFKETDVLPQLLEAFSTGLHRVLVQSGEKAHRIITQSDVAVYLNNHITLLTSLKDKTATEFASKKKVKVLDDSYTAFAAFRELLINNVQAAPIVDKDGKIIAALSLSDTRGLNKSSSKDLFLPVLDYLKKQEKKSSVVTLQTKDTLQTTLKQLVENKAHRAWIVDDGKVVGSVSLTDISTFLFTDTFVQKYFREYQKQIVKQFNILRTPLASLITEKKDLVSVESTTTQKDVIDLLAKRNFTSVPVKTKDSFVGIVSVYDIFYALLLDSKFNTKETITKEILLSAWEDTSKRPISHAIISQESASFLVFDHKENLYQVLDAFSQGYHRVLVNTASGAIRFLSQSDVVVYLNKVLDRLGSVIKYQAKAISKADGKVKTVTPTQTALSAFRELFIANVPAAPVIDTSGLIVGNLSVSDLRGVDGESIVDVLLPVEDFLKKRQGGKLRLPVVIAADEILSNIISLVVKDHVHRVWIVAGDMKPLGVISLTDILSVVLLDKLAYD